MIARQEDLEASSVQTSNKLFQITRLTPGGDLLLETYNKVMADEYPELAEKIHVALPDEKFRRVGQSAIAASLPEIR